MKKGKVSESVLRRSVLKYIKTKREEVTRGASIGFDCAFLSWNKPCSDALNFADAKTRESLCLSTQTVTLPVEEAGKFALYAAVNNLAAGGAQTTAVTVSIALPVEAEEARLQEIMQQLEGCCKELNVQVAGGHTEVSDAVRTPIITITAVGTLMGDSETEKQKNFAEKDNLDIIMTKWIGIEGTVILAKEKEEALTARYPLPVIRTAAGFDKYLSILPEAATAHRSDVYYVHDMRNGGVFGALWELSKCMGVGLSIHLKDIPVKQETIELCEFFDLNPYELLSGGSLLIAAADGEAIVKKLEEKGIFSAVIGKTTKGNDKVILNEDETRFLEPAKPDEIYKVNFNKK